MNPPYFLVGLSKRIFPIFCLVLPIYSTIFSKCFQLCQHQCIDRNLVVPLPFGANAWNELYTSANLTQRKSACYVGCEDLDSTNSTCDTRCSALAANDSCLQGCRAVFDIFLNQFQGLLNNVDISVTSEYLKIHVLWSFDGEYKSMLDDISSIDIYWGSQSRIANSNLQWSMSNSELNVFKQDSLQWHITLENFTSESIELRLCTFWRSHIIVSKTFIGSINATYSTPKAPLIYAQLQLSSIAYVICWTSSELNSDFYRITLSSNDGTELLTDVTNNTCYLFDNLHADNCCKATVSHFSADEMLTEINVSMESSLQDADVGSDAAVIIANELSLSLLNTTNSSAEPTIAILEYFSSNSNVTAICAVSSTKVLVGTHDGSIYSVSISDKTSTIIKRSDGITIIEIDVDHLQQKFYAVMHNYGILRCDLAGCENPTVLAMDEGNFAHMLSIDSWNGFIYYLTSDGKLSSIPLFPYSANATMPQQFPETFSSDELYDAIEIDFERQRLLLASRTGSIRFLNLINKVFSTRRSGDSDANYNGIEKFHYISKRLYWITSSCTDGAPGSCFYREIWDENEGMVHRDRYFNAAHIIDFAVLRNCTLPFEILPPKAIGLLATSDTARLTWEPSPILPFQATKVEWRDFHYDCKFMNEQEEVSTAKEISNITGNLIDIPITSGIRYQAFVRVCIYVLCSKYINTTGTSFAPYREAPFILIDGTIGNRSTIYGPLGTKLKSKDEFDYTHFSNLSNPFAFDSNTGSLYIVDSDQRSLLRVSTDGSKRLFLATCNVKHLLIMPKYAEILIATDYAIWIFRTTSAFDQTVYTCESFVGCSTVVGIAADEESGKIFFLIRHINSTVSLFQMSQENRGIDFISSALEFPTIKQLLYVKEMFVFIAEDGRMGVFDTNLGSLNMNLAISSVYIIPRINSVTNGAINFSKEIIFSDESRKNFSWDAQHEFDEGTILYKVSIWKDSYSEEKIIDYTLAANYLLHSTLLEKWPSQQVYDVQIDAITPLYDRTVIISGLKAPTKPPSPPRNLKIYATQQKTIDGARAIIDLFWDQPVSWNGEQKGYIVNCSISDSEEQFAETTSNFYSFSVKSGSVSCSVGAQNDPSSRTFSPPIQIDSSELRPLIRLFAVDSKFSIIEISNWSSALLPPRNQQILNLVNSENVESNTKVKRQATPVLMIEYQWISFIDNNLYAIRKDKDVRQPYLLKFDSNDIETELSKVQVNGDIDKIDAITSDWVSNRLLIVSSSRLYDLSLEGIKDLVVANPHRLMNLSSGAGDAKQLLFDPFRNIAYLLTKNGSLFALYLNRISEENMALKFNCLRSETVTSMMTGFLWNSASLTFIYVLTWNGMLRVELSQNECSDVEFNWGQFGAEKGIKTITSFTGTDNIFVFVTPSELIAYDLLSGVTMPFAISDAPLKQILIASQSLQPYPDRSCFMLPDASNLKFTVISEERSGALISVEDPPLLNSCPNISKPITQYEVHYKRKGSEKVRSLQSITQKIHIGNGVLDKDTEYELSVSWFNRYSPIGAFSSVQLFQTGFGFPSAPIDLTALALAPDTVVLYWKLPVRLNAPISQIKYRVLQANVQQLNPSAIAAREYSGTNYEHASTDSVSCLDKLCSAKVPDLRPSTNYKLWVKAIHESRLSNQLFDDSDAVSSEASAITADIAGNLRPDAVTGNSIALRWTSLEPETMPEKVSLQYRLSGLKAQWESQLNATFVGGTKTVVIIISSLRSATLYDYRFVADYSTHFEYEGSEYKLCEQFFQATQQIRTKAGTPSAPINVRLLKEGDDVVVGWELPQDDGGSAITSYALEFRPSEDTEWEIAERGLTGDSLQWKPPPKFLIKSSEFRIRAANTEGFGVYAYSKRRSDNAELLSKPNSLWKAVLFVIPFIAVITLLAFLHARCGKYKQQKRMPKKNQEISMNKLVNNMSRLPSQLLNDLKVVPRLPKSDVTINRTIGKSNFGEIFEGILNVTNLSTDNQIRVSIKTLRNGYSQYDQKKFLQEAILLSNFDHPNIIQLLGVSLENDPFYLIVELMEAGDLLGFLRSSRPSECFPSQLSLYDLIGIMVDVGRASMYLEANQYVHKDLAARNCSISSRDAHNRVTKIAEFGFARDVYANDYFRIHDDALVPLRWLAPESMKCDEFTSKSDVWSYGILLFEVLTLGQLPYKGQNNAQVLSSVKSGGKLERPQFCPVEIFQIVSRTWIFNPSMRPSFAELLPDLEALRGDPAYQSDSPYPPAMYSSNIPDFNLSIDSNISHIGSADRSGSVRFDKSDNPSTKKHGRPSILRSLRKERPKHSVSSHSSRDEPGLKDNDSDSSFSTDIHLPDSNMLRGNYERKKSVNCVEYNGDSLRNATVVEFHHSLPSQEISDPTSNLFQSSSTHFSNDSSSQDSNSFYIRSARVSRV